MAGTVPVAESLKDIYADDALAHQTKRWRNLFKQFEIRYGHAPSFISRSPGRVNIIGEHIDYSLYGVLPMAITADALLAVSTSNIAATDDHHCVKVSNIRCDRFPSHEFDIPHGTIDINPKVHEWTNYFKAGMKGAVELLRKKYGNNFKPRSMDILMDGTVPAGGGLSSSAAFVTASALAVMYANGETCVDKTMLTELAIVSERAVGVNSGGMDQSASVFSLRGSALYVSFVPTLTARSVSFPQTDPEVMFLIAQSFVQSDKHVTGPVCYNLRVVECSLAAAYLNAAVNPKGTTLVPDSGPLGISLRGFHNSYFADSQLSFEEQLIELVILTKNILNRQEGYTIDEIAQVIGLSVTELNNRFTLAFPVRAERFLLRQRAIHVFSEALRVLQFLSLLENANLNPNADNSTWMKSLNLKLGDLMNATQDSCRDDYACSCPEIDDLCSIARNAGAYGSRLTGAGWGGCTVHLVPTEKVEAVQKAWERDYYSKMDLSEEQKSGAITVSRPGSGSAVFIVTDQGLF